jgi:hypothetical protein
MFAETKKHSFLHHKYLVCHYSLCWSHCSILSFCILTSPPLIIAVFPPCTTIGTTSTNILRDSLPPQAPPLAGPDCIRRVGICCQWSLRSLTGWQPWHSSMPGLRRCHCRRHHRCCSGAAQTTRHGHTKLARWGAMIPHLGWSQQWWIPPRIPPLSSPWVRRQSDPQPACGW